MSKSPSLGIRDLCILAGIIVTFLGGYQCVKGHAYRVAAENEATAVGRVLGMSSGRGGSSYRYTFSINGVRVDDYSEVCETELKPGACYDYGPVVVYYSYQPFQNSRLEDFAVASKKAYRSGEIALRIGLPLLIVPSVALEIFSRRGKGDDDSDSVSDSSNFEDEEPERKSSDQPDDLHVVPEK